MGAIGKYSEWLTEDGLLKLQAYARDGLTDEQIANNIGISYTTLYEWKNRFPQFTEALKLGKEVIDVQVENALFKRATGFNYVEEKEVTNPDGSVIKTSIVKTVAPDVTAQIFWLKNRKQKEWRDRQDLELTGKDGGELNIKIIKADYSTDGDKNGKNDND